MFFAAVIGWVIVAAVAIVLAVVSGAVARLILRLPADRLWVDAVVGFVALVILSIWRGLADDLIVLLGLSTWIKAPIDQFIAVVAVFAAALPALRQVLRLAVRKAR